MVTKKQLAALAKGRAIRAANCKKKNTKAKYTKKQTKRCGRIRKGTNISFNQLLGSYQADYEKRKPKEEPEPIEASPTMWQHVSNAANASWKALNSVTNAIGNGFYNIGDFEWNTVAKTADRTKKAYEELKPVGKKAWETTKEVGKKTAEKVKNSKAGEYTSRAWDSTKNKTSKAWDATKSGLSTAWDATKSGVSKGLSTAWDATKEYAPLVGHKAVNLIKEYGPKALDVVKLGGEKALKLLKRGGKPAVEALEGPQGRLGAMKVLITEINNKLDSFDYTPSPNDIKEVSEKTQTLNQLLEEEEQENPELPSKIPAQIGRLTEAVNKIVKEMGYTKDSYPDTPSDDDEEFYNSLNA